MSNDQAKTAFILKEVHRILKENSCSIMHPKGYSIITLNPTDVTDFTKAIIKEFDLIKNKPCNITKASD